MRWGGRGGIVYDFLATALFPQLKNNLGTLRGWGREECGRWRIGCAKS